MAKLDMIAEPGKQELIITRVFDAPRELVFKVWTDPKRIPDWWGPRGLTTTVERMEVKHGGRWRFVQQDPSGEYAFRGVYHDVVAPERIISTFEWEGMPGHVLMDTVRFEEKDGKTTVTSQSVFQSVADRDGMLQSGMEGGAAETYDRFTELLEAEQQRA